MGSGTYWLSDSTIFRKTLPDTIGESAGVIMAGIRKTKPPVRLKWQLASQLGQEY